MSYADPRITHEPPVGLHARDLARLTKERDKLTLDLQYLRAATGGWVACSERLPDCTHEDNDGMFSQSVLVCDADHLPSLGLAHLREGGAWELYGGDSDCMHPTTITHWMPWPDSPQRQAEAAGLGREYWQLIEAGSLEAAAALYRRVLNAQIDQLASGRLDAEGYRRRREHWETALLRAIHQLSPAPAAAAGEVRA